MNLTMLKIIKIDETFSAITISYQVTEEIEGIEQSLALHTLIEVLAPHSQIVSMVLGLSKNGLIDMCIIIAKPEPVNFSNN